MLTKEKLRAVLCAALFVVVGMMISIPSAFASSTSSDVFIVSSDSGAEVKTMELRAIKENGEVRTVSDFAISIENVVSVERNGQVTVFSAPTSPTFTSAKITDVNDNTVDILISETGVISLAGYSEGVYTLDVVVEDRFAFECIVVIGPEEGQEQIINKQITEVNQQTDEHVTKILPPRGVNKERVCLFTPSHPICKPINGKCPPGWGMNEDGQCFPANKKCPPGYWRADDDETGACVPLPRILPPLFVNGTPGFDNATDLTPPATNETDPTPPATNVTDQNVGGGGGVNQTTFFEPPIECPEGEQLTEDGLSCEPIMPEPPIECPEGEQLTEDGLSCEPIVTEEPTPIECGEGEELIDGECQAIPTEEETIPEEEPEEEEEESSAEDEEADNSVDEEAAAEDESE